MDSFSEKEVSEAYALGLMSSGLWLEWAKFCQTEEGIKVRNSLRRRFNEWGRECRILEDDLEGGIGEMRVFLMGVFEKETEKVKRGQGQNGKKNEKRKNEKMKKNGKGGRSKTVQPKPVKFKNIK